MTGDDILFTLFGLLTAAALPILILWIIVAFCGMALASARGQDAGKWFLFTLLFGPIGILFLALFPVNRDTLATKAVNRKLMKWCPFCWRAISTRAIKCCFCHSVISPLAVTRRQLDLQDAEEANTPRDGIRKAHIDRGNNRTDLNVISQAIHLCGGGVPPDKAAQQLHVSEVNVRSWIRRYMEDDAWMRRIDMIAFEEVNNETS